MSLRSKQCRACCILDSVLTTGYVSLSKGAWRGELVYPAVLGEVVHDRVDYLGTT